LKDCVKQLMDASYDNVSVSDNLAGRRHLPRYSDVVAMLSFLVIVRWRCDPPA